MAGLVPATHDLDAQCLEKSWVAGTSMPLGGPELRPEGPAMTRAAFVRGHVSVVPRTGIMLKTVFNPCVSPYAPADKPMGG